MKHRVVVVNKTQQTSIQSHMVRSFIEHISTEDSSTCTTYYLRSK